MLIAPPHLKTIKPVEPEHLIGDKIQPGHPLFGLVWINPGASAAHPAACYSRRPLVPRFDAFVAVDKNLEHEQNLKALPLPIIVLDAMNNSLDD